MSQAAQNNAFIETPKFAAVGGHGVDMNQFTLWENPIGEDIVLELHKETPKMGKAIRDRVDPSLPKELYDLKIWEETTGKRKFKIPAGGKAYIPSEYDRAIQDVRNGTVVGGLGHMLRKVGVESMPVVSPALDQEVARRKAAENAQRDAMDRALAAERELAELRKIIDDSQKNSAASKAAEVKITEQPVSKKEGK